MNEGLYANKTKSERMLAIEAQIVALQRELAQLQSSSSIASSSETDFVSDTNISVAADSPTRIVITGLQQAGLILQSIIGQPLVGLEIIQDGLPVFTNQALADMRGYTLDEIRSFTREEYWNLIHPDHREAMNERYLARKHGEDVRDRLELLTIRKDGTECWFEIFVTPIEHLGEPATLALFVDATKRKQTTESLRNREQQLTALFDNSLDAIIILDNDGYILEANPASAELFGRPVNELIGQQPVDFAQRKDQNDFKRILREFLEQGTRDDVLKIERPDGAIRHAEYRARANYILGLHVAFMRDVTTRVEAEAARIESERAFKSLAENMPDLITRVDRNLNYTYVNPTMARAIGRSSESLIGTSSVADVPDSTATRLWAEARRAVLATGEPQSLNFSVDLPEGPRHFYALLVPEFDDEGTVETVLSVNREVTEAKIAEARIRDNEAFIRNVTDNVPYMILVYSSLTDEVVFANQAFVEFMRPTQNEAQAIASSDMRSRIHPEDMPLVEQVSQHIISSAADKFVNTEVRIQNPAGEWRWMKLWISAFKRTSDGSVQQYMGIIQDITEQRQAQTQMLKLALEEERVHVLTDFIQAASHEFRTPLSSINTSLYMLQRLFEDETAQRYLTRIEIGADQILMLVEALLQLSELDGIQQLELSPIQIEPLIEHVLERFDTFAAQRNITLRSRTEEHLPAVAAHARHLTNAISHLVDNALRYTPDGGTVDIDVTEDQGNVKIAVIDNGIGMSPEVQAQAFQRFFRMDTARSTRGLGLGLPSVEKIVQLHGGEIGVQSVPGEGSTFSIILPGLKSPETEQTISNLDTQINGEPRFN